MKAHNNLSRRNFFKITGLAAISLLGGCDDKNKEIEIEKKWSQEEKITIRVGKRYLDGSSQGILYNGIQYCGMPSDKTFSLAFLPKGINTYYSTNSKSFIFNQLSYEILSVDPNKIILKRSTCN